MRVEYNGLRAVIHVEDDFHDGDVLIGALETAHARYANVIERDDWLIVVAPCSPRVRRMIEAITEL